MSTENLINFAISILFYLVIAGLGFLGLFGIYIFIRYGPSRVLTVTLSLTFFAVFIIMLLGALHTLSTI